MSRSNDLCPSPLAPRRHAARFAIVATLALAGAAPAIGAITHSVTIQPIQVRRNDGTAPANAGRLLWENYADKIWAQAGIDVTFLSWRTLDKTPLLAIDDQAEFTTLTQGVGNQQHATASVINMYFVNSIYAAPGFVTYGLAWNGGNGIAIADPTFSYNSNGGRLDTLAHELGHNLGLAHAGGALRLMAEGNIRTIPTVLGNVFPDGLKTDQLIQSEITTALASGFAVAVPTPAAWASLALGLVVAARRRRTGAA